MGEGPSDERNVSLAGCQTQRVTFLSVQMLPGNKNTADAEGRGTRSAFLISHHLNETMLLFVS